MSAQLVPSASQRCHWCVKAIVGVPVQVPSWAVRVPPSTSGPDTVGVPVLWACPASPARRASDPALSLPPALVPVTTTRTACPTSAGVRSYVEPVAPVMSVQLVPSASQRCHWCPKPTGGVPVQAPSPAVRGRPSRVVLLTGGGAGFPAGGGGPQGGRGGAGG